MRYHAFRENVYFCSLQGRKMWKMKMWKILIICFLQFTYFKPTRMWCTLLFDPLDNIIVLRYRILLIFIPNVLSLDSQTLSKMCLCQGWVFFLSEDLFWTRYFKIMSSRFWKVYKFHTRFYVSLTFRGKHLDSILLAEIFCSSSRFLLTRMWTMKLNVVFVLFLPHVHCHDACYHFNSSYSNIVFFL